MSGQLTWLFYSVLKTSAFTLQLLSKARTVKNFLLRAFTKLGGLENRLVKELATS